MLIRPASLADVPAILDIYNWAVFNTAATYDYEPHTLAQRIEWFSAHQRDAYPVWVAEANGQVVGWSSLSRYKERVGYRFTAEDSIYIAPAFHGQGLSKRLLPPLLDAARAMNLHVIVAGVDSENEASLRLHTRFGFEQVARFKQVGYKFGRWLDVIYLELVLN